MLRHEARTLAGSVPYRLIPLDWRYPAQEAAYKLDTMLVQAGNRQKIRQLARLLLLRPRLGVVHDAPPQILSDGRRVSVQLVNMTGQTSVDGLAWRGRGNDRIAISVLDPENQKRGYSAVIDFPSADVRSYDEYWRDKKVITIIRREKGGYNPIGGYVALIGNSRADVDAGMVNDMHRSVGRILDVACGLFAYQQLPQLP